MAAKFGSEQDLLQKLRARFENGHNSSLVFVTDFTYKIICYNSRLSTTLFILMRILNFSLSLDILKILSMLSHGLFLIYS